MGGAVSALSPEKKVELKANFEAYCKKAAQEIADADIFLLSTGAGFSADSGLAVYKDIADIDVYHERDLSYHDICIPDWVKHEPNLFYGFWGMCFNDYRECKPHEGYYIIKRWKEELFSSNKKWDEVAKVYKSDLAEEMKALSISEKDGSERSHFLSAVKPEEGSKEAGPFFVYTSNVDAHSIYPGLFGVHEVVEIHGNTETWQCASHSQCDLKLWKAPADFKFNVDKTTMYARKQEIESEHKGWQNNQPTCPDCGGPARPAILMFGDMDYIADKYGSRAYHIWEKRATACVNKLGAKAVILEVGCGNNVPSVRWHDTGLAKNYWGVDKSTLIRVNPDFPLSDSDECPVIPIMAKGLDTIKEIDKHLRAILEARKKAKGATEEVKVVETEEQTKESDEVKPKVDTTEVKEDEEEVSKETKEEVAKEDEKKN